MSVKNVKVNDSERSIDSYFNEIKNMNPLSKKDERKLWKRYREKNDMQARESLINANLKFVPTVAKHFKGCGLPLADIIEEGNLVKFSGQMLATVKKFACYIRNR